MDALRGGHEGMTPPHGTRCALRRSLGGCDFGGAMSKADEYYARAAQCKIRAAETTDPEFRREFEQLAQKWNDLAMQEEIDGDSLLNTTNPPGPWRETKVA
jgi:hypothetical protein